MGLGPLVLSEDFDAFDGGGAFNAFDRMRDAPTQESQSFS
jgi:hypothetical protein